MGEQNLNFTSIKESDVWAATSCSLMLTNHEVILYPHEEGIRFSKSLYLPDSMVSDTKRQ